MKVTFHQPPATLRHYVQYFWTLKCDEEHGVLTLKTFANDVSGIIFQHHQGRSAWGPTTAHRHPAGTGAIPTSFAYGKRTLPSQTFATGPFEATGLVFNQQGQSRLLNIDSGEILNGPVELGEFSGENIADQLLHARSQHERFARLGEFLRSKIDGARPEDVLVTEGLRQIHQQCGAIRVSRLAKHLSLSERQFERRFGRAVGIAPHQYIRIVRFQEAMRLMRTNRVERMADIAHDLRYSDQSHLIKDIKEFSGYTPTALLQTVKNGVDLPCFVMLAKSDSP